jgi:hypothetical protein
MIAKANVKGGVTSARSVSSARSSVLSVESLVMGSVVSKAAATLWHAASEIVRRVMRRLVWLGSVSVSVVQTLDTKNCGAVH